MARFSPEFSARVEGMIATADDWRRVGNAVTARMEYLSIGPSDIEALGGPTGKPLSGYLDGTPIKRRDVKRRLCKALGWSPNSIDRILAGDEPMVLTDNPGTASAVEESPWGTMALLEALDERMGGVESSLSEVLDALRVAGIEVPRSDRHQDGPGVAPTSP
jgi:hypothetical protein